MSTNTSTLVIRPMTAADVDPLAAALGWPAYGIERRWNERLAGYREILVAVVNGEPVGSASTNVKDDLPGLLHLFALDVASAHQNRGIGTRLIQQVETIARERYLDGTYLEVSIANAGARRLYSRLGYQTEGAPFANQWVRYDAEGDLAEEIVETVERMFKRFD
jgi:ribosomal protein S18 acetylase RimI-like enzyme